MPHRATTLLALLKHQAALRAHATALLWHGRPTSYHELYQSAERFADQCARHFAQGDRIGVLAWNCPDYVTMLYAIPAANQILVPLNVRLAAAELVSQINDAGIKVLFGHSELLASLPALPDLKTISFEHDLKGWLDAPAPRRSRSADHHNPAWMLFTSGSTGRPKGALLSQHSLLAGLQSASHGRPVQADDRYLYPFPLFHIAAHNVLLQHQHGATVVLLPSFDASTVLRACQQQRITTLSLAPTMIRMLLDHPDFTPGTLAQVRTIGYGASGIAEDLLSTVQQLTPAGLSQSYGMTELSGSVTFLDAEAHRQALATAPHLLKSAGKPVPGVEIKLHTDGYATGIGEILVRAQQVMLGYWGQAEATARTLVDGWLHTGDIGRFDESGNLYIVDRKKDMIISGGENVASREVEAILEKHPGVSQAAVVGVPDRQWGEKLCALVKPAGGQHPASAELTRHCRRFLAGYKTPKSFLLAASVPVNAAGKVDKVRIKTLFADGQQ